MEQKFYFINEYLSGTWSFKSLCKEYGISRTLGYKYIARYKKDGFEGLKEISRAPLSSPTKTSERTIKLIKSLRKKHPRYGGEKLQILLKGQNPDIKIPGISTINLILKKEGLVKKRRNPHHIEPTDPVFISTEPNDMWSADYKGKFRMGDHQYISPLTIMDTYSCFLLSAQGLLFTTLEETQAVFRQVFMEYGLPLRIHTDNGSPFAGVTSLARLSQLAVWFIEHRIIPVYSDPGHPEQNGRHERMHREMKAEVARPPANNRIWQQRKLNEFVHEYNFVRPHKALQNQCPGSVYTKSERVYTDSIEPWDYSRDFLVKRVYKNGAIRWKNGEWIMIATPLIGKDIGFYELDNGIWRVYFRNKLLGYFDESILRIRDIGGTIKRGQSVNDVLR